MNTFFILKTAIELSEIKSIKIPKAIKNIVIFTSGVYLVNSNLNDQTMDLNVPIDISSISYYGQLPRHKILLMSSHTLSSLSYREYNNFLNNPIISHCYSFMPSEIVLIMETWLIFDGEDSDYMYYHFNVHSGYDNIVRIMGSSY